MDLNELRNNLANLPAIKRMYSMLDSPAIRKIFKQQRIVAQTLVPFQKTIKQYEKMSSVIAPLQKAIEQYKRVSDVATHTLAPYTRTIKQYENLTKFRKINTDLISKFEKLENNSTELAEYPSTLVDSKRIIINLLEEQNNIIDMVNENTKPISLVGRIKNITVDYIITLFIAGIGGAITTLIINWIMTT